LPRRPAEGIDYMRQVLAAPEYPPARGVIHRGIKPSDIVITPSGEASLLAVPSESLRGGHCRLVVKESTRGPKRRSTSGSAQCGERKRVQVFVLTGALTHHHA
jgi:serine/threonine protein kinase